MPSQIAIVHGWSDSSKSFRDLRDFLAANGFQVRQIWLGDYISMDDDVRVEDVAKRMNDVVNSLIEAGELTVPFDLIVHSTGGLVAREWISRFYPEGTGCPVKRLVMLAPANFGSALAALGKSMIGRVAKGWRNWFQTGEEMLRGLELASPYQWELACRDLLDPNSTGSAAKGPYAPDKVLPFVIIGTRGYPSGLRQIVNEGGSDGTVRAAAANLNAVGMTIDFSHESETPSIVPWASRTPKFRIPFAVLPDRDHSTIIRPDKPSGSNDSDQLARLILQALACDGAAAYRQIARSWDELSEQTAALARDEQALEEQFDKSAPEPEELHQYFHVIVRVEDDHGAPVNDYFLEFFPPDQSGTRAEVYFHRDVLEDVHVNKQDSSMRSLYVDRNDLLEGYYAKRISQQENRSVAMSISAAKVGSNIRYFDSTREGAKGHIVVHSEAMEVRSDLPARLLRNTTHLIRIVIPRKPVDKVFKLTR
ncbi:MAG: hypothetical protein CMQ43_14235 [Gammaproteobacteria bacterium]|nr:hypothetical protein [Gammaproteobacteria bacterium]|tara:strand:+ start:4771 stop:6207 length:1437 start_codon:yes stop_codon:yes gene_type:complete